MPVQYHIKTLPRHVLLHLQHCLLLGRTAFAEAAVRPTYLSTVWALVPNNEAHEQTVLKILHLRTETALQGGSVLVEM